MLRSDKYVYQYTILQATHLGSPCHMHEYSQDAMTYMRNYGRPNLYIMFTFNPKWPEITNLLLTGQTSSDRHDITAPSVEYLVFKQISQYSLISLLSRRFLVYSIVGCIRLNGWSVVYFMHTFCFGCSTRSY